MPSKAPSSSWQDIRGRGFADRAPLASAFAWLDALAAEPALERLAPAVALGRVLAAEVIAPADLPPVDRAVIDGAAVAAADTAGASAYNPLPFVLSDVAGGGAAVPVDAGSPLPAGADAVLSFAATLKVGSTRLEVLAAIAPGEGVEARGTALAAGKPALAIHHRLQPQDLALLAMLGLARVPVLSRPRVAVVLPGPKACDAEALSEMLRALLARDGARPLAPPAASLVAAADADAIIVAGRSGAGEDDAAAPELVAAGGKLALHGIALRPGASAGLGTLHGVPVFLLPGEPLACLTTYDMLVARLLRRLAHLTPELPYLTTRLTLARKIVSAVGFTDVVPVAIAGDQATPLGAAESVRLPNACRARGFVVVPEALEGHASGETVTAYLYGPPYPLLYGPP